MIVAEGSSLRSRRPRHECGEHPGDRCGGSGALGPYIPLAAKLGRLAMELAAGKADEIVLTSYGGLADHDTRLLTVAALNGAFQVAPIVP